MLLRDDVVDVERRLSEGLGEVTILAAMLGPSTYGLVNRFVH